MNQSALLPRSLYRTRKRFIRRQNQQMNWHIIAAKLQKNPENIILSPCAVSAYPAVETWW